MSSIFDRIVTLTKAAINEGLNKIEDPVLLTGQYLRDLDDTITGAERKHTALQAEVNVLERRKSEYTELAAKSEDDAVRFLSGGHEAEARQAVAAKLRYMESLQETEARLETARISLDGLAEEIRSAKEEHKRLSDKRAELVERARKAAGTMHRAESGSCGCSSGLDRGYASRGFGRMEEKIMEWEARAERPGRYSAYSGSGSEGIISPAVEAELERLRKNGRDETKS